MKDITWFKNVEYLMYDADEIYAIMIQHGQNWFHGEILKVITDPDIVNEFNEQDLNDFKAIALGFVETRYLKGTIPYNAHS